MAWQTPLDNSLFSPQYQAPPPELLSKNFQVQNQPQYQPTDYLTSPLAYKYHNELLKAKDAWNTAQDDINLRQGLINLGGLTDEQKQGELNKISLLRKHQQDLANAADMTRKTAGTLGINLNGFGTDNTAEESQQYILNNNARAMQGLLNLPSVREQQRNYYDELRRNGVGRSVARYMTEQKFDEYRNNNINQLRNGFLNFGQDPDGSVNSLGMAILSRMSHEDPMTVELFSNKFATPNNVYSATREDQRLNSQVMANERASENNFNRELLKMQVAQNYALEQLEHNAAIQATKKAFGTPQNKMLEEISNLTAIFGGGEEGYNQAVNMYLRQNYDKSFNVPRDKNGNIQISDAEKVHNVIDFRISTIEHFLDSKNFGAAKEAITDYRNYLLSNEDAKIAEQMTGEGLKQLLQILDLYEQAADGEKTVEEIKNPEKVAENNSTPAANQSQKKINYVPPQSNWSGNYYSVSPQVRYSQGN